MNLKTNKATLALVVACCALLFFAAKTVVNLQTQVVGVLPILNGGTGITSAGSGCVLTGEGGLPLGVQCPGDPGTVLTSNGGGGDPSFQTAQAFIDLTVNDFEITPTQTPTTAYLDCTPQGSGGGTCSGGGSLDDGSADGQLLTIVCSSYHISSGGAWNITGDFNTFTTLSLGGVNAGSYDLSGNLEDTTGQSCGAVLMWSNANGVWELVQLYGGTTS